MARIALTRGKFATVDDADVALVSAYKWQASKGSGGACWYAVHAHKVNGKTKLLPMHRLILNAPSGVMVDHIDGDGLNNARGNLRLASNRQNQHNTKRSWGRSGLRGVSYNANPRLRSHWFASIRLPDGRRLNLGQCETPEEASARYKAASLKYHGEFSPFRGV